MNRLIDEKIGVLWDRIENTIARKNELVFSNIQSNIIESEK